MQTRFSDDYPILLWWAECVDLLNLLTARNRARVLSLLADDIRESTMIPGRVPVSPWLLDRQLFEVPHRVWRLTEPGQQMRIIG